MSAKRAPRWGVYYRSRPHRGEGAYYSHRSAFTVRGKTYAEALEAALKHRALENRAFILGRIR